MSDVEKGLVVVAALGLWALIERRKAKRTGRFRIALASRPEAADASFAAPQARANPWLAVMICFWVGVSLLLLLIGNLMMP